MGISDFTLGKIISYKSETDDTEKQVIYCVKYEEGKTIKFASKVIKYTNAPGQVKQGDWYGISKQDYNLGGGAELTL